MTHGAQEQPHPERLIRGARAARSLSEALWETLQDAAAEGRTGRVAELSARLAEISLTVAALADAGRRPAPAGAVAPEPPGGEPMPANRTPAPERQAAPLERETGSASEPAPSQTRDRENEPAGAAVLIDELAQGDPLHALDANRSEPEARPSIEIRDERVPTVHQHAVFAPQEHDVVEHAEPAHAEQEAAHAEQEPAYAEQEAAYAEQEAASVEQEAASVEQEAVSVEQEAAYVEQEAAHAEQRAAPWTASIERRLERYEQDGHAFALMLLELADVQRLRHAELPGEVARLTALVETELSAQLRPADSLMRETPGRYWLLAPQTDDPAAQALAEQMTAAVARAASHRGAPLRLAVGIAVFPQDALEAAELVDRAELALYEAHASGRALAPSADPSVPHDELDQ